MNPLFRQIRQSARTALLLGQHVGEQLVFPSLRRSAISPEAARAIHDCVAWLESYMGQPHPQLGRNGEICPYIKTALRKDGVRFSCYDTATTLGAQRISVIFFAEGVALERHLSGLSEEDADMAATCVLFPKLRQEDFDHVGEAHTLIKGRLMKRGMMISAFYPGYPKPGIYNPAFELYQSPYPLAALRMMAIRDLAFVEFNSEAFNEYRRRFAPAFAAGKVSNKFNHVDRYRAAEQRFPL